MDIDQGVINADLRRKIDEPSIPLTELIELRQSLIVEQKATMGEYNAELVVMAEEEQRVQGRKKDYAPAIHAWVQKLAEHGVLEDLIKDS
jgi:ubiquitin carboxyl-terminal hydrolase L5